MGHTGSSKRQYISEVGDVGKRREEESPHALGESAEERKQCHSGRTDRKGAGGALQKYAFSIGNNRISL